jgi:hypothetical protein
MKYEGDPIVVPGIKTAFPLAKIQNHQARSANGDLFYSVNGTFALVPDPFYPLRGFFAGEEVTEYKALVPAPKPQAVKQAETKAAWTPAPPADKPVSKVEQPKTAWVPDPPKRG